MTYFSVVIPTYNRAHLVRNAIESVLNQTFDSWELIIADDASEDNIAVVVSSYNNTKIKFLKNSKNLGNAGARNLGAKHATGKYIAFLDSDDVYKLDYLYKVKELIQKNDDVDFGWVNVNRIDVNGNVEPNFFPKHWDPSGQENAYKYFLRGLYFGTDFGFFIRQKSYLAIGGFDESLRVAVDTDFILRCSKVFKFVYTCEILVNTFDHEGERVRRDSLKRAQAYDIIYAKHQNVIDNDVNLKNIWFTKMMWLNYHACRKRKARKYLSYFFKKLNLELFCLGLIFELFPVRIAKSLHTKISVIKKKLKN